MKAIEVQKYMEIILHGKVYDVLTAHVGYDNNVHMLLSNVGWVTFSQDEEVEAREMTIPF